MEHKGGYRVGDQQVYQHKVQYYETDQMGIVHHSNYIRWFEEARTDYMERMGLGYNRMEEKGIISPVLSVEADYLRMVHFGDTVSITCFIRQYNGIKLTIGYEIVSEKTEMVHCRGTTKHCFLDKKGKPVSLKRAAPDFHKMFQTGLNDSEK